MSENHDNGSGVNDSGSLVSGGTRKELTVWQKVGIALLVAVVALGFIWLRAINRAHKADTQNAPPAVSAGAKMHAAPLAAPPDTTALPMPAAQPIRASFFPHPASQEHRMTPAESPIFAASSNSGTPAASASPAPTPAVSSTQPQRPDGPAPQDDRSLAVRLKPTILTESKAHMLPHPDFLITKGTIIPCVLQTALNTQLAGYARCEVPQDIRSTTGNVVLLDKGTLITGEMQHGLMRGEDRAFVIWDRAETPEHAVIELDSPATDPLGRSGIPVTVNNHWWARFGDAILLSVIQGGLDAGVQLASRVGSNNSGAYFNSFQSNGQQVANTALQADMMIPPTGEKAQGKTVAIFVARDLDFSDIYDLQTTVGANAQ